MKLKRPMIIILFLFACISVVVAGSVYQSVRFHKRVKALFLQAEDVSHKTFSYTQLTGLPLPVQRYFKHVLKEGRPYVSCVRLKHDGQFKTGPEKGWVNITGEQYFITAKPGFIWKGSTAMFTAQDMYLSNKGSIVVALFSCLPVVSGKGEKYDQGELLRWLGESVWFPTNLLPNENVHWTPVNAQTAQLTFNYNGLSLSYLVQFNDEGEIVALQTKRYMGEGSLETWLGKVSDYKEMNGIRIPTTIEAIYRLEKMDYSYAKFKVRKIEYDKPEKF